MISVDVALARSDFALDVAFEQAGHPQRCSGASGCRQDR